MSSGGLTLFVHQGRAEEEEEGSPSETHGWERDGMDIIDA